MDLAKADEPKAMIESINMCVLMDDIGKKISEN